MANKSFKRRIKTYEQEDNYNIGCGGCYRSLSSSRCRYPSYDESGNANEIIIIVLVNSKLP